MKINLKNKTYDFLISYQNDSQYRMAFNKLTKNVFGLSFEAWYEAGYWNDKYIPYTLFDGSKALANASVNIMDFNVFGKPQRYIQIGTVATDENYRNQGLSRFLMEKILKEWDGKCDFIYLYANKTALEFYPKLGFSPVKEYECFKSLNKNIKNKNFEKLNMDIQENRDMLYDYIKNSVMLSKISMRQNADLVMFYAIAILKENIYYIKSVDVIAVAVFKDNKLHLWDVFSKHNVSLDDVIACLVIPEIESLVLEFTPEDSSSYEMREINGDDALFIQNHKTQLFEKNKIMFPLLSHA